MATYFTKNVSIHSTNPVVGLLLVESAIIDRRIYIRSSVPSTSISISFGEPIFSPSNESNIITVGELNNHDDWFIFILPANIELWAVEVSSATALLMVTAV